MISNTQKLNDALSNAINNPNGLWFYYTRLLSHDKTTKYVILISIELRLDTKMTDVPCDALLSDCEHLYVD